MTHPAPGSATGDTGTGPRSTSCACCSWAEGDGSAVAGGGSETGGGVGSGSGGVTGALGSPVGPAGSPAPPARPSSLPPPTAPAVPLPPFADAFVDGFVLAPGDAVGAAVPRSDSPGRGERPFVRRCPPATWPPPAPAPAASSPRTTAPCGPVERAGPGCPASSPTLTHPVAAATVMTAAANRNGTSLGRTGSHLRGRAKRSPCPTPPPRGRTRPRLRRIAPPFAGPPRNRRTTDAAGPPVARPVHDNGRVLQMTREEFEELVSEALDRIPPELTRVMDNVAVFVEDEPSADDPELLGLYEGTPLTERGEWYAGVLPDRISVYMGPTLRHCASPEEVVHEVSVTVVHEVAHHFGIEDTRLHELGWG
ncbi:putative Zn-dependent protease with MMP-like domain [Streptomyces sp. B3I8]|nr:putative Zn-dependent protease with MMP-like domain [Streptomyces sp. B3I8]